MPRINIKHPGTFKDGKFIPDNPDQLKRDILSMDGKKGYLVCMPYKKMKSNQQQKYYFAVIVKMLGEYWGYSIEEAHQAISMEHLKYKLNDKALPLIKSTKLSEWSTDEWERYTEFLRIWAANTFGVVIPNPDEIDMSQIKDVYY